MAGKQGVSIQRILILLILVFIGMAAFGFLIKTAVQWNEPKPQVDGWTLRAKSSALDDAETVTATHRAEAPIGFWPNRSAIPTLGVRCKAGRLDAFIITHAAANPELGKDGVATTMIRYDGEPATEVLMSESTSHDALFFPDSASLIDNLRRHERLAFEFTPFNSPSAETVFTLKGSASVLDRVSSACGASGGKLKG